MISYEASKWYVKLWRTRWYLYAIILHAKSFIDPELWMDYLLKTPYEKDKIKKIKSDWIDIKRHVELSKMYKFSARVERED